MHEFQYTLLITPVSPKHITKLVQAMQAPDNTLCSPVERGLD